MSAHINMENFLRNTLNISKLTRAQAQQYGVNNDEFNKINVNEDELISVDELIDELSDEGSELYEQFAVLYENNQNKLEDNKTEENKNKVNSKGDMKK